MKKLLTLSILMFFYALSFATVDCTTLVFDGANDNAILIYLPTSPNCDDPTFVVSLRVHGSGDPFTESGNYSTFYDGPRPQAVIRELEPCTEYDILVEVYCGETLEGGCYTGVPFSTAGCEPCCATPEDFTITQAPGSCDLEVCIEGFEDCDVLNYIVRYQGANDSGPSQVISESNCLPVTGLDEGEDYTIWVLVLTSECGLSDASFTQSYTPTDCNPCCATPEDFTITQAPGSCDLEVCIEGFEDCDVLNYIVRYQGANDSGPSQVISASNCLPVTGLDEGEDYTIWVLVFTSECGLSDASFTQSYTPVDCHPCCATPEDFTITQAPGSCDLEVCIAGYEDCDVLNYIVRYQGANDPGPSQVISASNCLPVTGLDEGEDYTIWVLVLTSECGLSDASVTQSYTPVDCHPCCVTPDDFTINQAPGSCDLEVCIAGYDDCDVLNYIVRYQGANDLGPSQVISASNCLPVTGLDEGEDYTIWVLVLTSECGLSDASDAKTVTIEDCSPNCCVQIDANYNPTASCSGVYFCISPLFHDEEFCEGTIFEYTIFDSNNTQLTPTISSTSSCNLIFGLDPCRTYYVKGKVIMPGGCEFYYNVEVDVSGQCCELNDGRPTRAEEFSGDIPSIDVSQINVSAFPNPFIEEFKLNFFSPVEEAYQFQLYDVRGQLIQTKTGITQIGNNDLIINDLSKLSSGLYIYQLNINDKVYSDRIVKK